MNKIDDVIERTTDLMNNVIDEGALRELQNHLKLLLEMKRDQLSHNPTGQIADKAKPLTYEELDAGGWWCPDTSEECRLAFVSNGIQTEAEHWEKNPKIRCVYKLESQVLILRAHVPIDVSALKRIYRKDRSFYWSE